MSNLELARTLAALSNEQCLTAVAFRSRAEEIRDLAILNCPALIDALLVKAALEEFNAVGHAVANEKHAIMLEAYEIMNEFISVRTAELRREIMNG